jgi:hypothetical protein
MKLEMPFAEALERFVGVEPGEMLANIKRAKKKKPPGGKKATPGNADCPRTWSACATEELRNAITVADLQRPSSHRQ